jgi:hypothetical protein
LDGWNLSGKPEFHYPEDLGKLFPWLVDSLTGVIRVLEYGNILSWKYAETSYQKVIDPSGVTTEFVSCRILRGLGLSSK